MIPAEKEPEHYPDMSALAIALGGIIGPIIERVVTKAVTKELRHQNRVSPDSGGWMTQGQAAAYLRISPKTLCQWRSEGKIKAHLLGKRWRYHKDALDAVLVSPWLTR